MNPNTYSLRSILQSDLDPALCKLMLHQIKSPLLEHSFQLTTDDEYNGGSISDVNYLEFEQNQQRGSHKNSINNGYNNQKQKNGLNRLDRKGNKRLDSMSMALSQYQFSRREHKPASNNHLHKENNAAKMTRTDGYEGKQYGNYIKQRYELNNKSEQSIKIQQQQNNHKSEGNLSLNEIVSPLQCNHQLAFPSRSDIENRVLEQTICERYSKKSSDEEGIGLGVAGWCGQIINAKNAHEEEIYIDRNPNYVRKKIFEKKRESSIGLCQSKQLRKKYDVTFSEAIEKLYSIQQQQVGSFIELIYRILSILNKITPLKDTLTKKQGTINKIILKDNPVNYETRQTICNKNRIINRLKVNKISEVFTRLVAQEPFSQKIQSNSFEINQIESEMSKVLQHYSQIEDIIENYVSKSQVVTHLHKIYNLLYDHQLQILAQNQVSQPLYNENGQLISPISTLRSWNNPDLKKQKNNQTQKDIQRTLTMYSLKDRLSSFLSSLKIDPQEFRNLSELSYIWSQINVNGGYSPRCKKIYMRNKQKFITQLCKNDVIIHGKTRGITELQIEKKLLEMGYKRNVE